MNIAVIYSENMDQNAYQTLIVPPNYSDKDKKKNMFIINEYGKLLQNKNSSMITKKVMDEPLGRVYTQDTGSLCADTTTGEFVPRYAVINAKKGKGFLGSAEADLNDVQNSNIFDAADDGLKCSKVAITEIDVYGNKTTTNKNIVPEGFEPQVIYEAPMDPGVKFFVGTLALTGLYMYSQLLYR
jgi:hypothetical protein